MLTYSKKLNIDVYVIFKPVDFVPRVPDKFLLIGDSSAKPATPGLATSVTNYISHALNCLRTERMNRKPHGLNSNYEIKHPNMCSYNFLRLFAAHERGSGAIKSTLTKSY